LAVSRRSSRSRFTLLLLVLTSITVITLDFRGEGSGMVESVRDTALDVFAPVQSVTESAFTPFTNAWNGITNYGDLEAENARLKAQLDEVQWSELRGVDAERELQALQDQLGLEFLGDIPRVPARVVGGPVSNFELTVELDRGRRHGVNAGMPVVTGAGLAGQVVQASDDRAVVQLLTDLQSSVGIRMARSGQVALANGAGRGQDLVLETLGWGPDVPVRRREAVVTSGISLKYPPGIPIGRVAKVRDVEGSGRSITVEPAADLEALEFVQVLQWTPPPPSE
jgi:rod shape-determining protein MreC